MGRSNSLRWMGKSGWWTANKAKFTKTRVAGRPIWVTNGTTFLDKDVKAIEIINPRVLESMLDGPKKQAILSGKTNKELMAMGKAPIGNDGFEMTLHHTRQREPGTMMELPGRVHSEYHGVLHPKKDDSWRHDSAKRKSYNQFFDSYWKWRADN